jgi:predicted ribosomally synthesized peptide with nif11-like leader
MSVKSVKAFFDKVAKDKELQAKLKLLNDEAKDTLDVAIAELIKIAKAEGFEFTADDYAKARAERSKLSPAELKSLTTREGGFCGIGWVIMHCVSSTQNGSK